MDAARSFFVMLYAALALIMGVGVGLLVGYALLLRNVDTELHKAMGLGVVFTCFVNWMTLSLGAAVSVITFIYLLRK